MMRQLRVAQSAHGGWRATTPGTGAAVAPRLGCAKTDIRARSGGVRCATPHHQVACPRGGRGLGSPPMSLSRTKLRQRRLQTETYLELSRIHRVMEARVAELLEEAGLGDITPAQAAVLTHLFQEKETPLTARALSRRLSLSEVTVGRFVRALAKKGWVSRTVDPDDARAYLLRPTRKAYRALPKLIGVSNALIDEAFSGFRIRDVQRLHDDLVQIRTNLGAGDED
ncbi:MAG: MarR family transcriptional regulator [Deltaproteobacteria bacterium]|nr:MAG: MarR family transcriptional regulator [Deltaproteobacteria bacterium]